MGYLKLPPQEKLLELFNYNSDTGELRWKKTGRIVKRCNHYGYLVVGGRNRYYAHRIIWKWMTGKDPDAQIDHIDMNKSNNKWNNLRSATQGQNNYNTLVQRNNREGIKGIRYHRDSWTAQIKVNGHQIHLGRFRSRDEAKAARVRAATIVYGDFARESSG